MNISLNGEAMQIDNNSHLGQLVNQLALNGKRLAIEINLEIIPKSKYANCLLKEGDKIEIVHAIGGG